MTDLCFYKDRYKKEIEAKLVDIKSNALIFDKTIFYPECGGQPGDRGFWKDIQIIDTQKDVDGTPLHIVKDSSSLKIGDVGILSLDWDHRYKYMKEHSAQHLLSSLLFNEDKIGTVSVHQGAQILTIEVDAKELPDDVLLTIEDKANECVRKGLRIWQEEMSHKKAEALFMRRSIKVDGDVKVVFIENTDAVACGGVHVASTSEIGEIVYRGQEHIRGHVRTMWSCSDEAVICRRLNDQVVKEASRLLSAERHDIPSEIERLQSEVQNLRMQLNDAKKILAKRELEEHMRASEGKYMIFTTNLSPDDFQNLLKDCGKEVLILQEGDKKGFLYYGTKEHFLLLKQLGLKGGGRDLFFRGVYLLGLDDIVDKARNILGNE